MSICLLASSLLICVSILTLHNVDLLGSGRATEPRTVKLPPTALAELTVIETSPLVPDPD